MIHTETTVVRHLESWCQEHLGNHQSPQYKKYHERFMVHLGTKREEQRTEHSNGTGFGMSQAAGCLRAAILRRAKAPRRPTPGSDLVTFEIGHILEVMALAIIEASGFTLRGTQVPATIGPFASAADAVIESGPLPLPYPLILSIKTAGYKMSNKSRTGTMRRGFAALPLDGIREANYGWYIQGQLEMAALGIENALVVVVAKDMIQAFDGDVIMQESGSLSWYAELEHFEREVALPFLNLYANHLTTDPREAPAFYMGAAGGNAVLLPAPGDIASGWGGPNQAATGKFNPCKNCDCAGMSCGPAALVSGWYREDGSNVVLFTRGRS